jgi:hypothetical protein
MTPLKLILVIPFMCHSACAVLVVYERFTIITRTEKLLITYNCF